MKGDDMDEIRRRVDVIERNQSDQAKSITVLVENQERSDKRVEQLERSELEDRVREEARDEWRKRTELKLDGIYRIGWWVLATFGSLTLAALANLLYGGGGVGQ